MNRTVILLVAALALAGCNKTTDTTSSLQQAVKDAQNLTAEQKYEIACNAADALMLTYRAFVAQKQTATTNGRVEAAYAAVAPFCAVRPENYATALVALMQSVTAFKAALPKAA